MTLKTMLAALVATGLATAAAAQTSTTTETTTGAGTSTADTTTGAMSDTDFLAGIQSGTEDMSQWATELAGLDPEAEVQIIPLSELEGMDMAAFDQTMQQGEQELASARSAIEGHEALTEALEAEEYSAEDVLGVQVEGAESVKLYVDDRS
jgi:hypothetical protein